MMEGIRKPDIVIYLRPSETVSNRAEFGAERYETIEIQNSVQINFDRILENLEETTKIIKIDSSKSIDEISESIFEHVKVQFSS